MSDRDPLLQQFFCSENMNKRGLKRGKKLIAMEDVHIEIAPFAGENGALFCIFDGHGGKDCADKARQLLPKVHVNFYHII